jgi:hypothetical protein
MPFWTTLWVFFFPWTSEAGEEEAFIPMLFSSPSLSQNSKTNPTKTPHLPKLWTVAYYKMKKTEGTSPSGGFEAAAQWPPDHHTLVPWLDMGSWLVLKIAFLSRFYIIILHLKYQ